MWSSRGTSFGQITILVDVYAMILVWLQAIDRCDDFDSRCNVILAETHDALRIRLCWVVRIENANSITDVRLGLFIVCSHEHCGGYGHGPSHEQSSKHSLKLIIKNMISCETDFRYVELFLARPQCQPFIFHEVSGKLHDVSDNQCF